MSKITRRQQEICYAIRQWYYEHERAPTLDEIGKQVNSTRSTVHQHVQSLIQLGYLDEPTQPKRAYQIPRAWSEQAAAKTQTPADTQALPLLGVIAAGKPIYREAAEPEISPNELLFGPNRYALQVQGKSMIDLGIQDGDYVVIQYCEYADNGDVVVARIHETNEATLKRIYYRDDGYIELRPENSEEETRVFLANQVQVQGKMVGLFRKC